MIDLEEKIHFIPDQLLIKYLLDLSVDPGFDDLNAIIRITFASNRFIEVSIADILETAKKAKPDAFKMFNKLLNIQYQNQQLKYKEEVYKSLQNKFYNDLLKMLKERNAKE